MGIWGDTAEDWDPCCYNKINPCQDGHMSCINWLEYFILLALYPSLLFLILAGTVYWCVTYRGGYGWKTDLPKMFNYHPTMMIAGYVLFVGSGVMLYRLSRCCAPRYALKLCHVILMLLAIPCIAVGFLAAAHARQTATVLVKGPNPIPPEIRKQQRFVEGMDLNFYSLHSWMGLAAMGLFAFQIGLGLMTMFIFMCCDTRCCTFRAAIVPVHATIGMITFVLAIATCLSGLCQRAFFIFGDRYETKPNESYIINYIGAGLILLMVLTMYGLCRRPLHVKRCMFNEKFRSCQCRLICSPQGGCGGGGGGCCGGGGRKQCRTTCNTICGLGGGGHTCPSQCIRNLFRRCPIVKGPCKQGNELFRIGYRLKHCFVNKYRSRRRRQPFCGF